MSPPPASTPSIPSVFVVGESACSQPTRIESDGLPAQFPHNPTGTGVPQVRFEPKIGCLLQPTPAHSILVLVGGGVRPNTDLAGDAGLAIGEHGAIRVDRRMRTNVPHVLAAGDCVETWHRLLQAPTYLPLGTTAHKQGRVAGETAVGMERDFQGSLGTQVVKVFDLAVARTGLRESEARQAGFDPITVESTPWHHKAYYPGAHRLTIRVTGDRRTSRLLGAQIVGHWQAEVAKRIDTFATALFHGMTVDGMSDLDLSYTPPMGSPWDAVQEAAQAWMAGRT